MVLCLELFRNTELESLHYRISSLHISIISPSVKCLIGVRAFDKFTLQSLIHLLGIPLNWKVSIFKYQLTEQMLYLIWILLISHCFPFLTNEAKVGHVYTRTCIKSSTAANPAPLFYQLCLLAEMQW